MSTPIDGNAGSEQVWIGLAHVRPRRGNDALGRALGAFVPAVALAQDEADYVNMVVHELNALRFHVLEIEDIELFAERTSRCDVTSDIYDLARSLTKENPVLLDDFQAYHAE